MSLNLLIMGPPGAGKGTQAAAVVGDFGLKHLATGDLLRMEAAAGGPVGLRAKTFTDRGWLVPDDVMTELIGEHIVRESRKGGFLLDGYPRTVAQADSLGDLLAKATIRITAVLNLEVPEQTLVTRLANRLTCPRDQRTYHPVNNPPRKAGLCDECGTALITRRDDTEEVIWQRLKVYRENTAPLIEYYRLRGLLHSVDGTPPVAQISIAVRALVRRVFGVDEPTVRDRQVAP